MCRFEQNISNEVKKNNKILCKIKMIYIEMLYTENTKNSNHIFLFVIYWTSENTVKYAIQKIKSNVSIVKCFHCQMFPLSNVSIVKCFHCERSIQGLCLLVKHDEAKDVQSKDIVIDPLFQIFCVYITC